jgi:cyclopropane fatty-acyl-phospholipid synthase-like methyltransferase
MTEGARWDNVYRSGPVESLPWFTEGLDPDVSAAIAELAPDGRKLLSIGEGPGTQAIELARLGWKVTATDVSQVAMSKAKKRAAEAGVSVEFLVDDIVSTELTDLYSILVDRGCFHTLEPFERPAYVRNVRRLLEPGGLLILKTFSKAETGPGPYRFGPRDIRNTFEGPFAIQKIREAFFGGAGAGDRKALFCVLMAK